MATNGLDEPMRTDVSGTCRKLERSRQAYYKERKVRQRRRIDEDLIVSLVVKARLDHPRCGTRKLVVYIGDGLKCARISVGRDRLFDILRAHDLLVKRRKAFAPHTTRWDSSLPVSRNLLQDKIVDGPNQVFVADITYIRTSKGFMYLSLVTDYFSKDIVGWHLSPDLGHEGCEKALEMAAKVIPPGATVIHHSDRGCQYACRDYREKLKELGMLSSMTEEQHCYENSVAERVNGILKGEYFLDVEFRDAEAALNAVRQVVHVYNDMRIHETLCYLTPAQARKEPWRVMASVVAVQEAAKRRREQFAAKKTADGAGAKEVA